MFYTQIHISEQWIAYFSSTKIKLNIFFISEQISKIGCNVQKPQLWKLLRNIISLKSLKSDADVVKIQHSHLLARHHTCLWLAAGRAKQKTVLLTNAKIHPQQTCETKGHWLSRKMCFVNLSRTLQGKDWTVEGNVKRSSESRHCCVSLYKCALFSRSVCSAIIGALWQEMYVMVVVMWTL